MDHLFQLLLPEHPNSLFACMVLHYILKSSGFEILVISSILWNRREDKHWDWKLRDRSVRETTFIWVLRAMPLGHVNWHQQSTGVLYPSFVDIVNLYIAEIWIAYEKKEFWYFDNDKLKKALLSSKAHFSDSVSNTSSCCSVAGAKWLLSLN